ncbi:MAG: sugar phosphate isomerase/epimerase family protein [Planctomycetota bacterium]|jgi:sugar phosphate isomerase/epimerase
MKYSFMTFSTPELALADVLEVAKRYGYDGIEPRLDQKHAHGIEVALSPDERKAIRDQSAASGIALACLATSLRFADPANAQEMIDDAHARIDLAGDVGAPAIRVFGGKVPEGVSRERAADAIVGGLRAVADHALQRGVTLCMETHDDWRDPAQVAGILERVGHAFVGANWDVMHPVRAGAATVEESFGTLGTWVRHVHFHDGGVPDGGLVPIGTGGVDHRRMVELLSGAGFTGYLSGEWIGWEPYETHLPRELSTMKGYEREVASAG